jgi:hypothetical protein
MADTKHTLPAVEGDGVSYRGIIWFVIILTLVTVTCQLIIWVMLRAFQHQAQADAQPAPFTQPNDSRLGHEGRVYPDMVSVAAANENRGAQVSDKGEVGPTRLIVREPMNLEAFRRHESDMLTTYGVVDATTGEYRIPIERAKELVLERGLPVRGK